MGAGGGTMTLVLSSTHNQSIQVKHFSPPFQCTAIACRVHLIGTNFNMYTMCDEEVVHRSRTTVIVHHILAKQMGPN